MAAPRETAARNEGRSPVVSLGYTPRQAERTVLHQVVREHLGTFLATTARTDPAGLPAFLEQEFRGFLDCGIWSRGFARFHCDGCHAETLVPFSCKRRGFCPSCGGRRMAAGTAEIVDHILPHVPVRQWVLSLPHALRYRLAPGSFDPTGVAPPASPAPPPPTPFGPAIPPSPVPPVPAPLPPPATEAAAPPHTARPAASRPSLAAERARRAWAWADLMRRVFALDVLACACGGRLRFLAIIEDPPIVAKILAHLGLPTEGPALTPARPPPQPDGFDVP